MSRDTLSALSSVRFVRGFKTAASLGWVIPGAATEGATPLFFSETWRPFLVPVMQCHPVFIFFSKTDDFFCSSLSLSPFITFTRMSPPKVTPHLFYLSDLVSPLFFVNLPTNFFLRLSPHGGCHTGRYAPSRP